MAEWGLWLISGVVAGLILGRWAEGNRWRSKFDPDYRTAMCWDGRLYYVISEREYTARFLAEKESING